MKSQDTSLRNGNAIELHYWFTDRTHLMDAVIQNRCEYEFIGMLSEIITELDLKLNIETAPLADGGLKRWFKITAKSEQKNPTVAIALVTALATGLFITPIVKIPDLIVEHYVAQIFEDKELKKNERVQSTLEVENLNLRNEKLELEIQNLKQHAYENYDLLKDNTVVKKRRSNFYQHVKKYPKVEKVSITIQDENKQSLSEEMIINRGNFENFIFMNDMLEPIKIDNVIIEIISPVLKKGRYKWTGIYNGEPIVFNMKSKEFKGLIYTGEIEFKNGSSINCYVRIRRHIDNEGIEKIVGYDVLRVNQYFENDSPIETPEGQRHRKQREANKKQLKLFDNDVH